LRPDGSVTCWGCGVNGVGGPVLPEACEVPDATLHRIVGATKHTCGLDDDGGIVCWSAGVQNGVPSGQGFVDLALGEVDLGCALDGGGAGVCWGSYPIDDPPRAYTRVAVGFYFACGLEPDGAVSCWGTRMETPPPAGEYVDVSAAGDGACALAADGSVACWGGDYGQRLSGPEGTTECW